MTDSLFADHLRISYEQNTVNSLLILHIHQGYYRYNNNNNMKVISVNLRTWLDLLIRQTWRDAFMQ